MKILKKVTKKKIYFDKNRTKLLCSLKNICTFAEISKPFIMKKTDNVIRFDWVAKHMLRDKASWKVMPLSESR